MSANSKKHRILVVGQTPPPFHGQGIMIQMLVEGQYDQIDIKHIRMNFSQSLDQIGKVNFGKVLHMFSLVWQIYCAKLFFRPTLFFYPPAGPNKSPLIRDAFILLATRFLFRRTVFHFHANGSSQLVPKLSKFWQKLIRRALDRPDLSIELCEMEFSDGEFYNSKKIVRIPNAAPDLSEKFKSVLLNRDSRMETVRLLYLGTMCEGKGSLVLVDACKILQQRGVDFHVDFVGGYQPVELQEEIQTKIEENGLGANITLHGQLTGDDKWKSFANADIFCFPSHYSSEGFPVVLLEAMSFSLPIVSTLWRGIPAIVESGVNGYLVPIQSPEALADRLQELIESPDIRKSLGKNARRLYEERYTPEKHRRMMEDAFVSVIKS